MEALKVLTETNNNSHALKANRGRMKICTAPGVTKNRTYRIGAVWCEKIALTAPVRCAQLQAHWCDGRRTVAELLHMAL